MSGVSYPSANKSKSPGDLPERYAPMFEYVYRKFGEQQLAFVVAFQRAEARRLLAEKELLKTLTKYWVGDSRRLDSLRPMDVLADFRKYAEICFRAIGEECASLFSDMQSYEDFLYFAQARVVEGILPLKLRNSTGAVARDENWWEELEHLADPTFLGAVRKMAARKDGTASRSIEDLAIILSEMRTIWIDQSFGAFIRRLAEFTDDDYEEWDYIHDHRVHGGEWECLIDDSVVDAIRTITSKVVEVRPGQVFMAALRKGNRSSARDFLNMTLEHVTRDLLAFWWMKAAETGGPGVSIDPPASIGGAASIAGHGARRRTPLAGNGKRPRIDAGIEKVKQNIRDLKQARLSQEEICDRLGTHIRPANAAWNHLSWPEAFKNSKFRPAVKSWISRC